MSNLVFARSWLEPPCLHITYTLSTLPKPSESTHTYYTGIFSCSSTYQHGRTQLTDGLCCTCSCRSHSHHILSSHGHTVIAWGDTVFRRLKVWLHLSAPHAELLTISVSLNDPIWNLIWYRVVRPLGPRHASCGSTGSWRWTKHITLPKYCWLVSLLMK